MKKNQVLQVVTSSGAVVVITLERCQALNLDGERCDSHELRGERNVLCWTHRQAARVRPLRLVSGNPFGALGETAAPQAAAGG